MHSSSPTPGFFDYRCVLYNGQLGGLLRLLAVPFHIEAQNGGFSLGVALLKLLLCPRMAWLKSISGNMQVWEKPSPEAFFRTRLELQSQG